MLTAISYKIYEMRKYLVLSLIISIVAIPIANSFVVERDRNRNEMYGEAFWIYGFEIYNMTDSQLADALPPEWGFNASLYALPPYLGNITYEYPVFGLIFFAIAVWLYPGVGGLQPLWLNFLLVLVFNLNLVLVAILLRDKIYKVSWARFLFGAYFVYGLIMSAGGGKNEPIADCLMLMALILRKEGQMGKAMFTLGLAVQSKIYPAVIFPILFLEAPVSSVWFLISTLLTVIPFAFLGANFDSLISHFLNTTSYSSYIVNPMYPGLFLATPDVATNPVTYYMWPPALVPLIIYVTFMTYTIPLYLPSRQQFQGKSVVQKLLVLKPLYVYLLPAILFVYRWVMPWYLFWLGITVFLFDEDKQAIGYLKQLTVVGVVYTFGLLCNGPYLLSGPLPDFLANFTSGWYTIIGLSLMVGLTAFSYFAWKWTFERRERKARIIREAEARGELVI
ncbi:MAG: hypothetical protein C4K49_00530 [Candidatus Thorarchaeota archaeon]|nr:MAG: hypothetical protein C4K49_00530 [Candidatus Thorarchaeota archaeon]